MSKVTENPGAVLNLTENEQDALRMGAWAWLGGRGAADSLYQAALSVASARVAAAAPKYVCATCRTAWTGDPRVCPACHSDA